MYYSKRQLYALGETLGDSVTQRKVGGGMIYGGGGSSAPAQQNVNNTQIPDYLAPYASNMLNATQAQIFSPTTNADGSTSYDTFKPYTPYSNDPSKYFAGFSPMQQQAQSNVANMQMPGQYQQASDITSNVANQMGNVGNQYAQQATNPYAVQSYMSPYINNVLDQQLQENARQYGQKGAAQQSAATSANAFGGAREALMNAENTRNQNTAGNQLVAQGLQNAFQNAQQAQQFGANLNLQGLQGQQAAAGQLAGIGGQQLGAQQGIANLQNQFGGQQTQAQQNIINQDVQNYATAQQYPYMQLGVMNAMLRGLPTQQTSTSMYQAPPSTAAQLGGLGLAGLGAAGMYNTAIKKHGGHIKAMADGGAIPMKMMSDQQLHQVQQSPVSTPMDKMYAQGLDQLHGYIHNNPEASKVMSQPIMPQQPTQEPLPQQPLGGVTSIDTGDMTRMAEGGILSFASGSTKEKDKLLADVDADEKIFRDYLTNNLSDLQSGKGTVTEAYAPVRKEAEADLARQREMIPSEFALRTGLGMMSGAGDRSGSGLQNLFSSAGTSALGAQNQMQDTLKDINAQKKLIQTGTLTAAEKDQARRDAAGLTAAQMLGNINARKVGMAQAEATKTAGLAGVAANKEAQLALSANQLYAQTFQKIYNTLQTGELKATYEVNPQQLEKDAQRLTLQSMSPATKKYLNFDQSQLEQPKPVVQQTTENKPTSPLINPGMPTQPKSASFVWDPVAGLKPIGS